MARFFVPRLTIEEGRLRVEGEEARHLRRVLRLRVGDAVSVFDGSGREAEGVIEGETTASALIRVDRVTLPGKESTVEVTLAQSLLKGEKMDLVVRKAVELGVSSIVPFVSSRTVPSLDDAGKRGRSRRWEKIAVEACKQCGRGKIPPVRELLTFEGMLRSASPEALRLFLWEEGGGATEDGPRRTQRKRGLLRCRARGWVQRRRGGGSPGGGVRPGDPGPQDPPFRNGESLSSERPSVRMGRHGMSGSI